MTAARAVALPRELNSALLADAGGGQAAAPTKDDYAIPFLAVLQPLSPQVVEGKNGARPGMIYNTVTGKLYKEVRIVPVHYTRTFIEWVPRDQGGGFRGEHTDVAAAIELFNRHIDRATGKAMLDNGNELKDTRNWYVMLVEADGNTSPALLSVSSTQIPRFSKPLYSFLTTGLGQAPNGKAPPFWASVLKLTTTQQENAKGKWYGWQYEWLGWTHPAWADHFKGTFALEDESAYDRAKVLNAQAQQNLLTVDRDSMAESSQENDTDV